jgi:hypothetical protein
MHSSKKARQEDAFFIQMHSSTKARQEAACRCIQVIRPGKKMHTDAFK